MSSTKFKELKKRYLKNHQLWVDDSESKDAEQFTSVHLNKLIELYQTENPGKKDIMLDMRKANLVAANFANSNLSNIDFSDANLSTASFHKAMIENSVFINSDLSDCDLDLCTAKNIDFTNADMANCDLNEADLEGAIFNNTDLSDSDLRESNLHNARLCNASLISANLSDANLSHTDLTDAELFSATLVKTDLRNAILSGAKLYGISKDDWDISGVECTHVYLDNLGEEHYPREGEYDVGQFEKEFKELPSFTVYFREVLTPLDMMLVDRALRELNQQFTQCKIDVDRVEMRGINPRIRFLTNKKEYAKAAELILENRYNQQVKLLESAVQNRERLIAEKDNQIALLEKVNEFSQSQLSIREGIYQQQQAMLEKVLDSGRKQAQLKPVQLDTHVTVTPEITVHIDLKSAMQYLEFAISPLIKEVSDKITPRETKQLERHFQDLVEVLKKQPKEKSTIRNVFDVLTQFINTLPNALVLNEVLSGLWNIVPSVLK